MDGSIPSSSGSDNSKQVYVPQSEKHQDSERVISADGNGDDYVQNDKDIVLNLTVTTRELQEGCERDVVIERKVVCRVCNGSGGKAECLIECKDCKGTGIMVNCNVGRPFLILGSACKNCYGIGKIYDSKNQCWSCEGKRVKRVRKSLNVIIHQGMISGCKIIFREAGNEDPANVTLPPGNVVFILDETPNM